MKREVIYWVVVLVFLFSSILFLAKCNFPPDDLRTVNTENPVDIIMQSLVSIRSPNFANIVASGSVVSYDDQIFILTASHVARGLWSSWLSNKVLAYACHPLDVEITKPVDECLLIDFSVPFIMPVDGGIDLAAVYVSREFQSAIPITLSNEDIEWHIGDIVWHGGFGGDTENITLGYITGRHTEYQIFTNLDAWFGSSGGPVLNEDGQLIGVFASLSFSQLRTSPFPYVIDGRRGVTLICGEFLSLIRAD